MRMALAFLQYRLIPGEVAYLRLIRPEFNDKRGPACEWWLHAIRDGSVSKDMFA